VQSTGWLKTLLLDEWTWSGFAWWWLTNQKIFLECAAKLTFIKCLRDRTEKYVGREQTRANRLRNRLTVPRDGATLRGLIQING
jgi:hypothetical protein